MAESNFTGFFTDIDYSGKKTSSGDIVTYRDQDALRQAISFWLTSSKGEKIRTRYGGPVIPHLKKPMNEERANLIKRSIIEGLEKEFEPYIEIVDIQVIPKYDKKTWRIYLIGYAPSLKRPVVFDDEFNTLN